MSDTRAVWPDEPAAETLIDEVRNLVAEHGTDIYIFPRIRLDGGYYGVSWWPSHESLDGYLWKYWRASDWLAEYQSVRALGAVRRRLSTVDPRSFARRYRSRAASKYTLECVQRLSSLDDDDPRYWKAWDELISWGQFIIGGLKGSLVVNDGSVTFVAYRAAQGEFRHGGAKEDV